MTDRELMQQALDVLICCVIDIDAHWECRSMDQIDADGDTPPIIADLRERLAHCDRCGKRLGGEGDIHTCTPDPIGDAQDRLIAELAAQPEQEPVSMRMPKAGDKVICLEDESLATVVSLTAGGSPDIVFSDGSRGTYLLREFAELFGYATPPAAAQHQCKWPTCQSEEYQQALAEQINQELVTGAAQRTWVGLTDAELADIHATLMVKLRGCYETKDLYKAIEQRLKEKNT